MSELPFIPVCAASDATGNLYALEANEFGTTVWRRDGQTYEWRNLHIFGGQLAPIAIAVSGTNVVCLFGDPVCEEVLLGVASYTPNLTPPAVADGTAMAAIEDARSDATRLWEAVGHVADSVSALSKVVDALPTRSDAETLTRAAASEAIQALVQEAREHPSPLREFVYEVAGEAKAGKK